MILPEQHAIFMVTYSDVSVKRAMHQKADAHCTD